MKNRTMALGVTIVLLGLGLVACQLLPPSGENEASSAEEIRCEEGGYAFKSIPGYLVDGSSTDLGNYRMNPDDIDWEDPDYKFEAGPSIQLFGFVPSSTLTIEEYASNGVDQMSAFYQATISGQPQVSVAGLNGIAYDFDYEIPGNGQIKLHNIYVEVNPEQFWEIRCFSTVEKWDKTLADCETVINSVTFFTPKP